MGNISHADYLAMQARLARTQPMRPGPQPDADPGPEAALHEAILSECGRRLWLPFHGSMAHLTKRTPGEPDFIILADGGRLFLVEAKTKTGKLSIAQQGVIAWARKLGHIVHIVRSPEQFLDVIA